MKYALEKWVLRIMILSGLFYGISLIKPEILAFLK